MKKFLSDFGGFIVGVVVLLIIIKACTGEDVGKEIARDVVKQVDKKVEVKGTITYEDYVHIGNQYWMKKDLSVSHYQNGESIQEAATIDEFYHYCQGEVGCLYRPSFGVVVYNYWALKNAGGLAPKGYHIPTSSDYRELINYLGGGPEAAKRIMDKESWNFTGEISNPCGWNAVFMPNIDSRSGIKNKEEKSFIAKSWWCAPHNLEPRKMQREDDRRDDAFYFVTTKYENEARVFNATIGSSEIEKRGLPIRLIKD